MKKVIYKAFNIFLGIGITALLMKQYRSGLNKSEKDKMTVYYQLMNKWMKLREENKSVSDYMERHGFESIAIYGLGDIGKHLEKELENSSVRVLYAINKYNPYLTIDMDVYSPECELPPVDAVVVTPIMEYDEICKALKGKVACPIISIVDVLNELDEV